MNRPRLEFRTRLLPIILAQAIGFTCGVAGVKVMSALVPPNALGAYGVFVTLTSIGMWVVHAGVLKFVGRHWAAAADRSTLLRTVLRAWARKLPWLALVVAGATVALGRLPSVNVWLAGPALFAAAALLSLAALAQSALQAAREHWRDCAVAASGSVTRTFLPPLLFAASGAPAALWAGFGAHAAIAAGAALLALRRFWRPPSSTSRPPPVTAVYEGPLFIALALAGWILIGVNRWIVAGFFGEQEAGFFTLSGSIGAIVPSMLGTVFLQYFQPGFFATGDHANEADRHALATRVDRAAAAFWVLGLAAVGVIAWLMPWLVGPLVDRRYEAALPWILPAGCFGVTVGTNLFYHSLLLAGRRERACGPVELTVFAVLVVGGLAAALLGQAWLARWLVASALVPWLLTRPLARRYFFRPASTATTEPAP